MKKKILSAVALTFALCGAIGMMASAKGETGLTPEERAEATAVEYGKDYNITWGNDGDCAIVKVVLPKAGCLSISENKVVSDSIGTIQLWDYIYNAKGEPVWCNLTAGSDLKANLNVGLNEGTYYVSIARQYSYADGKTTTYRLNYRANAYFEKEVGPKADEKKTATPMEVNSWYTGYIGSGFSNTNASKDSKDVYKATLQKGVAYQAETTELKGTTVLVIAKKSEEVTSLFTDIDERKPFIAPYTGTYYFTVFNYSNEQYKYRLKVSTVKVNKPAIDSVKAGKKSFTLKYKKVDCDGYEVKYSTSKNFKNAKKVTLAADKNAVTVKNLKAKTTYYVHVRAYKTVGAKKVYSDWSVSKKVVTK